MPERFRAFLRELFLKLFEFLPVRESPFENVAFEEAGLANAVFEDHQTSPMLQSFVPVASVDCSVVPIHFSVSDLDIILVISLVPASRLPRELAVAVLLVVFVATLILIAVLIATLFPMALTVFLSIVELARIDITIAPHVLAEALSLTVLVLADVGVANREVIAALPVPQALLPLALVLVAVAPDVLAESVRLILDPLADIAVTFEAFPEAVALLLPHTPLPIIHFATSPHVLPLSMHLPIVILSLINIPVAKSLIPEAMALVVGPFAFVYSLRCISYDTPAISLRIYKLTTIHRVFVRFHGKRWRDLEIIPVQQVGPQQLIVEKLPLFIFVQDETGHSFLHRHVGLLADGWRISRLVISAGVVRLDRARNLAAIILRSVEHIATILDSLGVWIAIPMAARRLPRLHLYIVERVNT